MPEHHRWNVGSEFRRYRHRDRTVADKDFHDPTKGLAACAAPRQSATPASAGGLTSMSITPYSKDGKPGPTYEITANSVTATGTDKNGKPFRVTGRNMTEVLQKMDAAKR